MTREEAIDILRSYLMFDKSNMQIDIALNMAIEALQADAVPQSEQYKKGFEDAKRAYEIELARSADCGAKMKGGAE